MFLDEPSKPGRPNPTNWDKSFIDLEWEAPDSDGGAPIESYIVEMRDKDERNWVKALVLPNKYVSFFIFYFYEYKNVIILLCVDALVE